MSVTASSGRQLHVEAGPSSDHTIVADEVSVRYRLPSEGPLSLKEYAIRRLLNRLTFHEFWALRGVSLAIRSGEAFGIIGRNGAGKSTLLKVIARVLRPTAGRVQVRGQIAPLLDIGAGFHPELTGRENVYLNAALLGHPAREVEARFDDIVAFAELSEFIDAPLRTFSSGMMVRLGFAVATAWEPDILLIDEVLAVGDEAFQRKCRTRMESFLRNGTTLVLVSHNSAQVQALCSRAAWIAHGSVRALGPATEVTEAYRRATGAAG